jgi:asparagine synthase (glutamine-hydrolysing)
VQAARLIMCGIFAYFDPSGGPPPFDTGPVLAALGRRGPDGRGFVHLPGCSLLHTRLAILDPARGQQPMRHPTTGLALSYNGEVYNAAALRVALEARGHVFRTATDSEVVLAAFAEYGPASVAMLEGMFAFAIWDPRDRRLYVARDRMGEKPLFFAKLAGNRVMIASELKALCAADLRVSPDAQSLDHYLQWKHVPPDRSIYTEVEVVPPAHVLTFSADAVHEERYWHLPPKTQTPPARAQVLDELRGRLAASVRNRLLSDRPVGIFLSGGLDSTLVGALATQATDRRLVSYTASYGGDLDEAPRAETTARRFGFDHTSVPIGTPAPEEMADICAYLDQPHADSANLAHSLLSRRAAHDAAVVLSGDGADELFWGYEWYTDPRSFQHRLDRMTILPAEARRALLPDLEVHGGFKPDPCLDPADAINRFDLTHYLGGQLLPKADMVGMMHGLEIRAPFLDYRVVEYVYGLPALFKAGPPAKPLLRDLLARICPDLVMDARKQGFGAPLAEWLEQPAFRSFVRDTLCRGARIRDLLDAGAFDGQLAAAFARPDKASAYRIWLFLCLELWASSLRTPYSPRGRAEPDPSVLDGYL